jgi:hypothetical protein
MNRFRIAFDVTRRISTCRAFTVQSSSSRFAARGRSSPTRMAGLVAKRACVSGSFTCGGVHKPAMYGSLFKFRCDQDCREWCWDSWVPSGPGQRSAFNFRDGFG